LLLGENSAQQLLLETALSHREVDDGGLGGQLGREGRVGQTAGHEHLEIFVPVKLGATYVHKHVLAAGLDLLLQHGVEHGVDLVLNALDDKGLAFLHAEFEEVILEFGMVEGCDAARRVDGLLVLILDPVLALALWVNHQGVAGRVGDHDTVLDGEVVLG
jgi:hypothetical protein